MKKKLLFLLLTLFSLPSLKAQQTVNQVYRIDSTKQHELGNKKFRANVYFKKKRRVWGTILSGTIRKPRTDPMNRADTMVSGFVFTPLVKPSRSYSDLPIISIKHNIEKKYDRNDSDTLSFSFSKPWQYIIIPYTGLSIGVQSVPVRFGEAPNQGYTINQNEQYIPFIKSKYFQNINNSFSLGITLCVTWGRTLFNNSKQPINLSSYSLGIALPITSITLSSQVLKNKSVGADTISGLGSNPEILPSLVFIYSKFGFGVDVVVGVNILLGPYNNQWAYQQKPFLGIGLSSGFGGGVSGGGL